LEAGDQLEKEILRMYYDLYNRNLSRLCSKLCGNRQDAEDLFQDTWVKTIKNIDRYDNKQEFDKWLFSVCCNNYKNMLRSKSRRPNLYDFTSNSEKDSFLNNMPNDTKLQEEYIDLHNIINKLNSKLRIIIILFYFDNLSIKNIAEILHIPSGTVKNRLFKARNIIRERMAGYEQ